MSRIGERFQELSRRGEKALVCFITAGDPDMDSSEAVVLALAEAGVDIVEIGVPFSDPLADGPSIQASSQRALDGGVTPPAVLDLVRRVREKSDLPLVLMTYFNPVQMMGVRRFADEAAAAGADGVIMTDLPPEEAGEWKAAADAAGLDTIFLLAPTSTDERIRRVAEMGSGFIYCVSRTGVTGARKELPADVKDLVNRIRNSTTKPIVVGFGVSGPEQVREISKWADGAVVGSALVDLIASADGSDSLAERVRAFASALKAATV
ncbi:MAG: tryptophan synthase subunit alpha [Armatimonadetes bacterium]|nr:tryptophan synthase subunit alpha [Armatimonadota bacterium]